MSYDAQKVTYQEVTIFDRPALFTECRIDRATLPEDVYRYELRHGDEDWGEPVELARSIFDDFIHLVSRRKSLLLLASLISHFCNASRRSSASRWENSASGMMLGL